MKGQQDNVSPFHNTALKNGQKKVEGAVTGQKVIEGIVWRAQPIAIEKCQDCSDRKMEKSDSSMAREPSINKRQNISQGAYLRAGLDSTCAEATTE